MNQEIVIMAQKLYDLAQKANLLAKETFTEIFPERKLLAISRSLAQDKNTFILNSRDIKNPEALWQQGVESRISKEVTQNFVDYLQTKNKAFTLAYDQPVEDIVFNFLSVFPDFPITDTGESQVDGEWFQEMKIGDETFEYRSDEQDLVQKVLYDISRQLFPLSKGILATNFGDANQYLVVDLEFVPEFSEFGLLAI